MKRIIGLTALIMIIAGGMPLSAAEIRDINIGGNIKKTKDKTILNIIRFHEGDEIAEGDEETIRQRLIKSGLFVNEEIRVDLEIEGEEAVLSLSLRDRFSLIPFPIFSSGSGDTKGGLFLMDQNFLGTGNQVFTGFMLGEKYRYGMLSYTDTKFRGSSWDLGGMANYFQNEQKIKSVDGQDDLYVYDLKSFKGGLTARWAGEPWTVGLKMLMGAADYEGADREWIMFYEPGVAMSYGQLYFGKYMSEGYMISADYDYTRFQEEFDDATVFDLRASWQKLLGDRFQVELSANGFVFEGEAVHSPSVRSAVLDANVHAERHGQGKVLLNSVLFDFSWGYIALPLSYQLGWLDGVSGDEDLYHGPAAGLTLNLKKLTMPAISLGYGWNVECSEGVFNFAIGFSM